MYKTFITLITTLAFLILPIILSGQCAPNQGWLLINEVSNPESGGQADEGEFIELLVMGADSSKPVDVSGFIIDDNNLSNSNYGSTPGHIVLGDCFKEVMPGTIILIFDDAGTQPDINRLMDGAPNINGVYQIPFGSSCLIKKSICPAE